METPLAEAHRTLNIKYIKYNFQPTLLILYYKTKQRDVWAHFEKLRRVVYQEVIPTQFSWDWLMYDSK